jgi:hypothetical protein
MRDGADMALVTWAKATDRFVRIDRTTELGNPFEISADGTRAEVIEKFARHYLPHKPELLRQIPNLRGKVLGCWCHPERCHGHVFAEMANKVPPGATAERGGIVTGVAMSPYAERGLDCYETPAAAVRALLEVESFDGPIWQPACGPGAIVRVLRAVMPMARLK